MKMAWGRLVAVVRCSRPDITLRGLLARGKSMDTMSVSLYYSFF